MNSLGWIQLAIFFGILLLVTRPLGLYIYRVLDPREKTFLDPILKPLEKLFYRVLHIDPKTEQSWLGYSLSIIIFSLISMLFSYIILRTQAYLPLNPQNLPNISPDLAFNTAASFTSNTNWQSYGGESSMSYFSQMVALTFHNFASAAVGIAIAAVIVRAIAADRQQSVGNFWSDLVRIQLYLLLPLSLAYALFLVSQGVIQNFMPYSTASWLDIAPDGLAQQIIAQGPVASQAAIKMLGTNGGGFFNANAAHPFENPNALSNFVQMLSIFLIPSAMTYYLGKKVRKQAHGWAVWSAMASLFLVMFLACWWAESHTNPHLLNLGVDSLSGNMEGKEIRFGIFSSSLFATITTAASCGAVNAMHDSFSQLGGLTTLLNMQFGEVVFGGVGAGLYGMIMFIILAIFIAGLMVGRTPEYLGKKIESYDIKSAALYILVAAITILGFTSWASSSSWGAAALNNQGPHGFSEMLYAYTSATANNGSAFAGLSANNPWFNYTLGFAMLIGRFLLILPVMALAGNLAKKKLVATNSGSFPVTGATFTILLIGTVIIVGALTFLPALALGPILEHFLMISSTKLF